jgi:hypothetical protein
MLLERSVFTGCEINLRASVTFNTATYVSGKRAITDKRNVPIQAVPVKLCVTPAASKA